jgi:hypothetical protein
MNTWRNTMQRERASHLTFRPRGSSRTGGGDPIPVAQRREARERVAARRARRVRATESGAIASEPVESVGSIDPVGSIGSVGSVSGWRFAAGMAVVRLGDRKGTLSALSRSII